jgi:hypothetical protein
MRETQCRFPVADFVTFVLSVRQHFTKEMKKVYTVINTVKGAVRYEAFTAVTMKDVFWHIKTKFVPHRRHITSPLQSPTG